jgi:hypothetical protein
MPKPVDTSVEPMSPMFDRERHLLGWQGFSATVPANWNPAKFSGHRETGELRIDDDEGPRLEMRWEHAEKEPNIPKSVEDFLKRLGKEAKKKKSSFEIQPNVNLIGKKHHRGRNSVTSFGWKSDPDQPAGCGFGAAWHCPTCNRVTFIQIMGRGPEKPGTVERLASEVLTSMKCHGDGGWETWAAFDLQLEIPEEFRLGRAKLLLNLLELEWLRAPAAGFKGLGVPPERIGVRRYPVANVLLAHMSLKEFVEAKIAADHKTLRLHNPKEAKVHGHEALIYQTSPRDPRIRIRRQILNKFLRRQGHKGQTLVWTCPESNKIYVVETELSAGNAHVAQDVLDSINCH